MFKKSIKKHIMGLIANRIQDAQKNYNEEVESLEAKKGEAIIKLEEELNSRAELIEAAHDSEKDAALSKHVKEVFHFLA